MSELEFYKEFEECAADVDISKVDLNTTHTVKRQYGQHHYFTRHPEELHRATSDGIPGENNGTLQNLWIETYPALEGDDWLGDEGLYLDVVEQSSQRYASRYV